MISAHYGLSDVFDNLIISLCKFTALSSEVSFQVGKEAWLLVCWSSLPLLSSSICFSYHSIYRSPPAYSFLKGAMKSVM